MSNYKKYADLNPEEKPVPSDIVIMLKTEDQKKQMVGRNKVVVVDVYGDWCQPCKAIATRFGTLAVEYGKYGFVFAKENVDDKISQNVKGVPTFQYFYNGVMVDITVGADMQAVKGKLDGLVERLSAGM